MASICQTLSEFSNELGKEKGAADGLHLIHVGNLVAIKSFASFATELATADHFAQ